MGGRYTCSEKKISVWKEEMNKNLFLIHGAWASEQAFNYIVKTVLDQCKVGNIHKFKYDCQTEHISDIVERSHEELDIVNSNGLETVIVGHSLGGLIALDLSQQEQVSRTITMASPLCGIDFPKVLQYYLSYHAPIVKEIVPTSKFVKHIHSKTYGKKPIDVMIATSGFNPMIYEESDGVVTIKSQTKWTPTPSRIIRSKTNHHEILQSSEAIHYIEKSLTS